MLKQHHPETGDCITDIDSIEGGVLWETKTAGDFMVPDPEAWVRKHLLGTKGKIQTYLNARQYLPGYEDAPIGLNFTNPDVTPEFKAAVERAVDELRTMHPGVDIRLRWK